MVDRAHRELTDEHIAKIANTYDACRSNSHHSGESGKPVQHEDISGFGRDAKLNNMRPPDLALVPGPHLSRVL